MVSKDEHPRFFPVRFPPVLRLLNHDGHTFPKPVVLPGGRLRRPSDRKAQGRSARAVSEEDQLKRPRYETPIRSTLEKPRWRSRVRCHTFLACLETGRRALFARCPGAALSSPRPGRSPRSCTRFRTAVLAFTLFAGALPAGGQPSGEAPVSASPDRRAGDNGALSLASLGPELAPQRAAPGPTASRAGSRWSLPRVLLGASVAAGGMWYALSRRDCRLRGGLDTRELSTEWTVPATADGATPLFAELHYAYGRAHGAETAWTGSGCSLDWSYERAELWIDTSVPNRRLTFLDVGTARRESTRAGELPDALRASMQSTLRTEAFRPPGPFYAGLAVAGAGVLIASLFGRVSPGEPRLEYAVHPLGGELSVRFAF